jgi:CRISPR-associated protein Csm5
MEFMQIHNLVVSTLSPVHVGCGVDFVPTEYVVDAHGTLHAFEPAALATLKSAQQISNGIIAALDKGLPQEQLRAVHVALQRNCDEIGAVATTHVKLASGVFAHYKQTQDARTDFNKNGVERTSFNPFDQLPILPGSSIKGSIRTAILNARKSDKSVLPDQLTKQIFAFNKMIEEYETNGKKHLRLKAMHSKKDYEKALEGIEKALAKQTENLGTWLGGSFATDPLRALKVGDACSLDPQLERKICFCVNRNRAGRKSQAQSKGLYTRLEYVTEHQAALFEIAITMQNFTSIAGQCKQNGELLAPTEANLTSMPEVIRACNDYYLPRFEKDLQLTKALHPGSAWASSTETVMNIGLREEIKAGQVILLRVGKHGGADNNTVDGRQIKIMLSEDKRRLTDDKTENIRLYAYDDEPRTTWFCADELENPSYLLPHGWIVLSAANCSWIEQLPGFTRRKDREKIFQGKEQQRQQAEAEARLKEEEDAARQSALASMTPNQQQIEAFKSAFAARAEQLRGNKESMNGDFHNRARKIAQDALAATDWSSEEKRALADAIAEWLPKVVQGMDKDQLKKFKLSALRGLV